MMVVKMMLFAVDTAQLFCGWDAYGEPETVTQELPKTRRQVSVEQALLLETTVNLYWGDECIRRPGNYPNAKWECGSHKANTLIELIAYLALTRNV